VGNFQALQALAQDLKVIDSTLTQGLVVQPVVTEGRYRLRRQVGLGKRCPHYTAKVFIGELAATGGQDLGPRVEVALLGQAAERRQQLSPGQITGATKDTKQDGCRS